MYVILIIIVTIILIYLLSNNNNTPAYKNRSAYKRLVPEDKLRIDLTIMIETLVSESLKRSKENRYDAEKTNRMLYYDIKNLYIDLSTPTQVFDIASKYNISSKIALNTITEICRGAIGTYVINI